MFLTKYCYVFLIFLTILGVSSYVSTNCFNFLNKTFFYEFFKYIRKHICSPGFQLNLAHMLLSQTFVHRTYHHLGFQWEIVLKKINKQIGKRENIRQEMYNI